VTALTLNPELGLAVSRERGRIARVEVWAPVRGEALRRGTVTREAEPDLFAAIGRLARAVESGRDTELELTDRQWGRLAELGVLLPERKLPRPVALESPLPRGGGSLVPQRLRRARQRALTRWVAAAGIRREPANPALDPAKVWIAVDLPGVPVPALYSMSARQAAALERLRPGCPPRTVDAALAARWARAGLLRDAPASVAAERRFAGACAAAAAKAAVDRYAVLRRLLPPYLAAALRRYYRAAVAEGLFERGDMQNQRRLIAHNEPLARWVQASLSPLVARVAGEPVRPSYVYFARYDAGDLPPHKDRPQCELSLSLLVDYEPEPADLSPWALHVQRDGARPRAVRLGIGDALFYRGCELTHFRKALPAGHRSTHLFLHYVPRHFQGTLD